MNKKIKILIGVFVLIFFLNCFKNSFAQMLIESVGSAAAHLPLKIGSTQVQLSRGKIVLKNIKILNPRSFRYRLMLDAPLALVAFDLGSLWKGPAHFEEIRLDIQEIDVVKNEQGELNVDAMKPATHAERRGGVPAKSRKPLRLKIDKLYLTVGRVVYKDYSQGPTPSEQVFNIQIQNRLYTDIDNPESLVNLIVFEALTRTSISRLANLDVNFFKDGASGAFDKGLGAVSNGSDQVEEAAKGILSLFH